MNTDIRLAISFRGHRKRKLLKTLLGEGATDYLLDLWLSAAMQCPDGVLTGWDDRDIAIEAGWGGEPAKFVKALKKVRWLDTLEDGTYYLHDWQEHQPWACGAKARSEQAQNAARARWQQCGEHADSNAPLPSSPSPSSPSPSSPSPSSPSPSPPYPPHPIRGRQKGKKEDPDKYTKGKYGHLVKR